ncbi:hypothetical protein Q7C36_019816 [Tachysurus vachellii]|uniref:Uncharacterized protein n=1 Tax=Tachysurus vachellii TaxID=175792 RepID=A0AA88RX26_TACVA|nr:hypothetical protein Q7C36_019816 [Tachysurus vachellii]
MIMHLVLPCGNLSWGVWWEPPPLLTVAFESFLVINTFRPHRLSLTHFSKVGSTLTSSAGAVQLPQDSKAQHPCCIDLHGPAVLTPTPPSNALGSPPDSTFSRPASEAEELQSVHRGPLSGLGSSTDDLEVAVEENMIDDIISQAVAPARVASVQR